jgi:hypothetical protein
VPGRYRPRNKSRQGRLNLFSFVFETDFYDARVDAFLESTGRTYSVGKHKLV